VHGEAERLSKALDELDDRVTWDADRMLVEAIDLEHRARELGDELLMARAELTQTNLRMRGGDLATAAHQVPIISQRAADLDAPALLARTHLLWATLYRHLGDASNCLEHSVLSVTLLDDTATEHMQIWHRAKLGDALSLNGSLAEARASFEKAVDLATEKGRPMLAMAVLNNQAYAECTAGEQDRAREVAARMRAHAEQQGFELTAPLLDTIATVEIEGGEYAQAERTLLTGLEKHAVDPKDDADAMPEYLLTLARAQRGLGAYARAQENLTASRDLCVAGSLGQVLVKVHQEQARLHAARGDFAEAFAAHETFFEAYVEMRSLQDEARARTRHAMLETAEAREDADRFREQARRDPLTGLRNRRFVDERLGELIGSGGDLLVALADLDYFKRINDLFSHDTGDQVLIQVSRLLQTEIQPVGGAFAARLGGEEFLLVLPGVRPEPAAHLLESIRRAVDRHPWYTIAAGLNVTISLGAAWCSGAEPATTQRSLLSTADQHLYAAKHSGRNRVRHDLPRPRPPEPRAR
jgi:diguanylate cyclase (GGDEF)-like protein